MHFIVFLKCVVTIASFDGIVKLLAAKPKICIPLENELGSKYDI